jgi:hypothetical protein
MESWDGTPLRYMQAGRGGIRYDTIRRRAGGRAGGLASLLPRACLPCAFVRARPKAEDSVLLDQSAVIKSRAEQRRGGGPGGAGRCAPRGARMQRRRRLSVSARHLPCRP